MLENIHWLGHDSFRIDGSVTVYIDPWKLPAGQPAAGLILVTHDHFDHLSLPDIEAIAGPDTVVVGPASVTAQVSGLATVTLAPGESAEVAGVEVLAVPAYNVDKFRAPGQPYHPRESGGVGYVVALDGVRYYHAGDTDAIPEMRGRPLRRRPAPGWRQVHDDLGRSCRACELIDAAGRRSDALRGHRRGRDDDAERFRETAASPSRSCRWSAER